jgi:four helix bundle protein
MKKIMTEQRIEYGNILLNKSFQSAIRSVLFHTLLISRDKSLYPLYTQLKSATLMLANISEAQNSLSKNDFISKLNIALKESQETYYRLRSLKDSESLTKVEFAVISNDSN